MEKEAEWVRKVKVGGATSHREVEKCFHGWASPPGDYFRVRGPQYFANHAKVEAEQDWLLKPLGFDWIKSTSSKIYHVLTHPHCRVRAALRVEREHNKTAPLPFIWAINLQVPSKENHSLVFYYYTKAMTEKSYPLVEQFLQGDDEFRNSRFKLLANVVEGPWVVRKTVGEKAICLLGKAVTTRYYYNGEETEHYYRYMEIDVDIGSSLLAHAIVHLAFGSVKSLVVDLGFVLEAQESAELPERVLAAVRFANLDPSLALSIDHPLSTIPLGAIQDEKEAVDTALKHNTDNNNNNNNNNNNSEAFRCRLWRSVSQMLHTNNVPDSVCQEGHHVQPKYEVNQTQPKNSQPLEVDALPPL